MSTYDIYAAPPDFVLDSRGQPSFAAVVDTNCNKYLCMICGKRQSRDEKYWYAITHCKGQSIPSAPNEPPLVYKRNRLTVVCSSKCLTQAMSYYSHDRVLPCVEIARNVV